MMNDINPYESPKYAEPLDADVLDDNADPALKYVYRTLLGISATVTALIGFEGIVKEDVPRIAMVAIAGAGLALSAQQSDKIRALHVFHE